MTLRQMTICSEPDAQARYFLAARVGLGFYLDAFIMPSPRISVFPKCYFDELCSGKMNYLDWLRDAATLGGEGVEHYDGFFHAGASQSRKCAAS